MLSFVLAASLVGVEVEPPPLDAATMRALITDVRDSKIRLDALEAKVAAHDARCPCGLSAVPVTNTAAPAVQTHPYLYNVGDMLNKPTGPAAAQFYAAQAQQPVTYYAPQQYGGGQFMDSGDCSSGQCSGGSCGSSSGRGRGRRGRG